MRRIVRAALGVLWIASVLGPSSALAEGNLNKVNHIIVIMQENHSFDNYLGALAYAPGSPYHNGNGSCAPDDHQCVNGLTCTVNGSGQFNCQNSNVDNERFSMRNGVTDTLLASLTPTAVSLSWHRLRR